MKNLTNSVLIIISIFFSTLVHAVNLECSFEKSYSNPNGSYMDPFSVTHNTSDKDWVTTDAYYKTEYKLDHPTGTYENLLVIYRHSGLAQLTVTNINNPLDRFFVKGECKKIDSKNLKF